MVDGGMTIPLGVMALWLGAALIPSAEAALAYTESVDEELSSSGMMPTVLEFGLGVNSVSGIMGRSGAMDADIFSFLVAPQQAVTSIRLSSFFPTSSVGGGSFLAIDDAATINMGDGSGHAANQVVNAMSGELLSAKVLLGLKYSGGNATLTAPMGPGWYTVWFQEGATTVRYTLDFTVVPEPSAGVLVVLGLVVAGRRRRP